MKDKILALIYSKFPTQRKKITHSFETTTGMEKDLDMFLETYLNFMKLENITHKKLAGAYLEMLDQMMFARKEFLHSGKYYSKNQEEAFQHTYDNESFMTNYMLGLALSQFLWRHHYLMFSYYKKIIKNQKSKIKNQKILEVGSGHGLFLLEMLKIIDTSNVIDVVDISKSSIRITQNIIKSIDREYIKNIKFYNSDISCYKTDQKYDFITMGEVIEHVDDPLTILKSLNSLLSDNGKLFITTCVNCPTIDHVYLFDNVNDIRILANEAGFEVDSELVIPTEDKSDEYLERFKVDISYAAVLIKIKG